VDLEKHLGLQVHFGKGMVYSDHGQLDKVGSRALKGGVDRRALGKLTGRSVFAQDVGQLAMTAQQGGDLTGFARFLYGFFYEPLDAFVPAKVVFNVDLCHLLADAQLLGEPERAHPVNNPEVDHLGLTAHLRCNHTRQQLKNLSRCACVDILVLFKCFNKSGVLGIVGKESKLYLRIVCREHSLAFLRNKGCPNLTPLLGPHGNILKVGVTTAQTACGCDSLIVRRMDAVGFRMNQIHKGIGISGLELGERAVLKDQGREFMFEGKRSKYLYICGIASVSWS